MVLHKNNIKLLFLSELSAFYSRNTEAILIGGDFNIIRFANERNKNNGVQRYSHLFNSLIDFYELREIEMSGANIPGPTIRKFLCLRSWIELSRVKMGRSLSISLG